jgi:hypothetical protein
VAPINSSLRWLLFRRRFERAVGLPHLRRENVVPVARAHRLGAGANHQEIRIRYELEPGGDRLDLGQQPLVDHQDPRARLIDDAPC